MKIIFLKFLLKDKFYADLLNQIFVCVIMYIYVPTLTPLATD